MRDLLCATRTLPLFATLLLAGSFACMRAQQPSGAPASQITGAIRPEEATAIPHSTHPLIRGAVDQGAVSDSLPMNHMQLVLLPSSDKKAALEQFMTDRQNPRSTNYHQWLTPEQFGEQFGPSQADVQSVTAWLTSQGLTVSSVSTGRRSIDFSGTTAQVNKTFRTTMRNYQIAGVSHIANSTDISIPSALTSLVGGVVRLNDIIKKTPIGNTGRMRRNIDNKLAITSYSALKDSVAPSTSSPQLTDGTLQYLTPGDLAQIYDAAALNKAGTDGTGASVAVIGRSNVQLSDMRTFRQLFGLPAHDPQIVLVGPDPGTGSDDETESALDLEYAGALAPNATINFVIAQSTDTADGIDLAATYAVDHAVAPVITESYGECEAFLGTAGNQFISSLWAQAAAEGISVMISTGDSGSANCDSPNEYTLAEDGLAVNGLGSTPYNTAVGGTMFDASALGAPFWNTSNLTNFVSANGYVPENAWNEACDPSQPITATGNCAAFFAYPNYAYPLLSGGGGGASSCTVSTSTQNPDGSVNIDCTDKYAKPAWQIGASVPADGARDIPDVSFAAAANNAAYTVCVEGSCQSSQDSQGNVTLISASFVGGTSAATPTFAGIVALLNQKSGGPQGLLNYKLYQLANTAGASCNSSQQTDPTQRGTCIFHDITKGTNSVPCVGGTSDCSSTSASISGTLTGYNTTAGYDLATGLGSVDAANLVAAWSTATTSPSTTTFSATPTTVQHGQSIQISGKVTPASGSGLATGAVSLSGSNGLSFGPFPLTSGAYSAAVTTFPGGTYTLTANYPGDATLSPSNSSSVSITISPEKSTTTTSVLDVNPYTGAINSGATSQFGDNLLLRADIAGASGNGKPTGNVTMLLDGNSLGAFAVNPEGSVELQTGAGTNAGILPGVGSHTFSASFAGDSSFNTSSSTNTTFTVTKADDDTFLTTGNPSPIVGQQVLLNVYVDTITPGLPIGPGGTVQLFDNGVAAATGTLQSAGALSSGGSKAIIPYTFTTSGKHSLTAKYAGDSNFNPNEYTYSTSYTVSTGKGVASAVAVTTTSLQPVLGQAVTFYVSIAPKTANTTAPTPTGTATLTGATQGGVTGFSGFSSDIMTLSRGSAQIVATFSEAGNTPVYVAYSGDSYYAPSSGTVLAMAVQKIAAPLTLSASSSLLQPGSQIVVQAVVTGSTSTNAIPYPSGTVQFFDAVNGATPVALGQPHTLTVANGSANYSTAGVTTLAVPLPVAGTHIISASYSGDINYKAQQATTGTITVSTPDFTIVSTSTSLALPVGSSATAALQIQPVLGFNGAISLSCDSTTVPIGVQCAVSPSQIAAGSGNATLTLTAAAKTTALLATPHPYSKSPWLAATLASCFGILFFGRRKRFGAAAFAIVLCLSALAAMVGCASPSIHSTTVSLGSNSAKVAAGSTATYSATVTSTGSDALTGSVTFFADGKQLGQPSAIVSGVAKLDSSALPIGIHAITATFNGDNNHSTSTSNSYAQAITGSTNVSVAASSGNLTHQLTIAVNLE